MYQFSLRQRTTFDHWRNLAEYWQISYQAKERLEWIIFYYTVGKRNVVGTASYFGISRKTLHKWLKRFNPQVIQSLEVHSRAPHQTRTWKVTPQEEERIICLRTTHIKYGKAKLKVLYQQEYKEPVSTWRIERVIRKHNLYPDPTVLAQKNKRRERRKSKPKIRIHELKKAGFIPEAGRLWHTDTIVIWWYGQRRIIFTALEDVTKLGYARVSTAGSSRQAKEFLKRLVYLSQSSIRLIHSDNGSEFAGEFEKACIELDICQVYSRVKTPKDNPALERFNWTVQDEWLELSEVGLDEIPEANKDLTNWLIEYNFHRPHQALDYQTPIEYACRYYSEVLPMTPASTRNSFNML
jgi:transposase InsO family protein